MEAKAIIKFVLSEKEMQHYKDEEYGITEMDAYHFLSKNQYCCYFDWNESIDII